MFRDWRKEFCTYCWWCYPTLLQCRDQAPIEPRKNKASTKENFFHGTDHHLQSGDLEQAHAPSDLVFQLPHSDIGQASSLRGCSYSQICVSSIWPITQSHPFLSQTHFFFWLTIVDEVNFVSRSLGRARQPPDHHRCQRNAKHYVHEGRLFVTRWPTQVPRLHSPFEGLCRQLCKWFLHCNSTAEELHACQKQHLLPGLVSFYSPMRCIFGRLLDFCLSLTLTSLLEFLLLPNLPTSISSQSTKLTIREPSLQS